MPGEQENLIDLTDAERAAMAEPEAYVDEDEEGEGTGATEALAEGTAAIEALAEGATAIEALAEDTAATETVAEDTAPEPGTAIPEWQMPENHEERLAEFDTQAEELVAQFDAGEIRASDFHKQLAQINVQRADLARQVDRAEISSDMQITAWVNDTVARFLRQHPQYQNNATAFGMLDTEVKRLQLESDNPFDPAHLQNAHANLQAAATAVGAPRATTAYDFGGQIENQTAGRFARLDRLASSDPLAYEETLAKMSPAERDEYLATA